MARSASNIRGVDIREVSTKARDKHTVGHSLQTRYILETALFFPRLYRRADHIDLAMRTDGNVRVQGYHAILTELPVGRWLQLAVSSRPPGDTLRGW